MRAVALHFIAILLGITLSFAQSSSNRPQASFDQRPKATSDVSELLGKAGAGDAVAQFRLGLAYESGAGAERNYEEAAHWYRIAAEHGIPAAQNNLGSMYARGLGLPKDDKEAAKWYLRAAGERHPAAENNVGFIYATGRGVPQSDVAALSWYRRGGPRGDCPPPPPIRPMFFTGGGGAVRPKH